MSIIVNGASIPTNGDYIVVNGVKVEKVTANGVTVWEKETHQAKNAPPFLSAGWRTLSTDTSEWIQVQPWQLSYDAGMGGYIINADFFDKGTMFVSESEIYVDFVVINDYFQWSTYNSFILYSPLISTNSFSFFEILGRDNVYFEPIRTKYDVIRFSNDGVNWTNWLIGNSSNKSYKYAQVGVFLGAENSDDENTRYDYQLSAVQFS